MKNQKSKEMEILTNAELRNVLGGTTATVVDDPPPVEPQDPGNPDLPPDGEEDIIDPIIVL